MSKKYTIGIDFGTLSARAVALDLETRTDKGIPMVTSLEIGQPLEADVGRPSLILRRADGGSLWGIAKQTGSTMEAIRMANGLQSEPAQGQMLLIPLS